MPSTSIYRNLHKNCWSLTRPGHPVEHAHAVLVDKPRFVVQAAGNARVRQEKRKNVHAFVRTDYGNEVLTVSPAMGKAIKASTALYDWVRVSYNPYKHTTFVLSELADRPIHTAKRALLSADGKVYVEL